MVGVVIDIVAPIFGVVICGFIAGHVRLLDKAAIRGISIYVFNLAIPLLLFYAMAKMDLPDVLPWSYLLGYYGCCLLYTSPSPRDQRGSRMPSSA